MDKRKKSNKKKEKWRKKILSDGQYILSFSSFLFAFALLSFERLFISICSILRWISSLPCHFGGFFSSLLSSILFHLHPILFLLFLCRKQTQTHIHTHFYWLLQLHSHGPLLFVCSTIYCWLRSCVCICVSFSLLLSLSISFFGHHQPPPLPPHQSESSFLSSLLSSLIILFAYFSCQLIKK